MISIESMATTKYATQGGMSARSALAMLSTALRSRHLRKAQMRRAEVVPGDRYGQLTIVSEAERSVTASGRTRRMFNCRCDCGQVIAVDLGNLRSGHSESCGCVRHRESPCRLEVKTGIRFGKLVVISEAPPVIHGGQIRRQLA